jgi:site-specific DNA-cytosine methylase
MDTSQAVTHIGLCAGYGGIELGLKRAIPSLRTVALCEIEAFAIANLVSKMEAGLMDPAPQEKPCSTNFSPSVPCNVAPFLREFLPRCVAGFSV